MRKAILITLACVATACAAVPEVRADTVIGFDDLTFGQPVPNGYAGLQWNSITALNGVIYQPVSGYNNAVVSAENVAYTAGNIVDDTGTSLGRYGSFSSGAPFALNSFYLTAAWRDGLNVLVEGLLNGALVDQTSLTVGTAAPILFTLNWANIDTVSFTTSGGTAHGFQYFGYQVVMDDISITATPLPAALPLFMTGTGLLALLARRRTWTARAAAPA